MSQISYTFLRNNHTKQGRISTWTREQPGTTRKEKMMGDYTEHLISMAGGDGEPDVLNLDAIQARADAATEGPWFVEASGQGRERLHIIDAIVRGPYGDNSLSLGNDAATAEFIAAARTDVPALLALVREQQARIERVRELHTFAHTDVEPWAAGYRYSGDHCGFDGEHWPCPTSAALTATEGAA